MDYRLDLEKMQDFYLFTESQFKKITQIIPLDNNSKTYSPELYNILLSTCGQVESMMRLIRQKLKLGGTVSDSFRQHYKKLNNKSFLKSQVVYFIPRVKKYRNHIRPFVIRPSKETPTWWKNYNQSKHNLPIGIKQGNIDNTIKALAALYSLHYIGFLTQHASTEDLFKRKHWTVSWLADARDSITRKALRTEQYIAGYSDYFSMRMRYVGLGAPV